LQASETKTNIDAIEKQEAIFEQLKPLKLGSLLSKPLLDGFSERQKSGQPQTLFDEPQLLSGGKTRTSSRQIMRAYGAGRNHSLKARLKN